MAPRTVFLTIAPRLPRRRARSRFAVGQRPASAATGAPAPTQAPYAPLGVNVTSRPPLGPGQGIDGVPRPTATRTPRRLTLPQPQRWNCAELGHLTDPAGAGCVYCDEDPR